VALRIIAAITMCIASVCAARGDDAIFCKPFDPADITDAERYWTLQKQLTAQPRPMPRLSAAEQRELDEALSAEMGKHLITSQFVRRRFASNMSAFSVAPAIAPGANDANVALPPFEIAGRFTFRDPQDSWCTASFVGDTQILVTAAHCVADHSGLFAQMHFSRAYALPNGGEDFDIAAVAVHQQWISTAPNELDYAFLRTTQTTSRTPLAFATGSSPAGWIGIGYPALLGLPLEPLGRQMFFAAGANITPTNSTLYVMKDNPMKDGHSGGPFTPPLPPPFGATLLGVATRASNDYDEVLGPKLDGEDCTVPPAPPRRRSPTCQLFAKALASCQ
jgi:hypothetical protein